MAEGGETWTTLKVLNWTSGRFTERNIPSPRLDAEVLLAHALGTTRVGLYTTHDKPLSPDELTRYRDLVKRRLAGEPVAYLVGEQEFWSLPLKVDARVLIPRRDTETLVEVALAVARSRPRGLLVADVATGSGAVALALASELPDARIVATDRSRDALAVARENARRLGRDVTFLLADLASPLSPGSVELLVSNPPYVPAGDIAGLSAEVRSEPRLALDGGPDGLDLVRRLVVQAAERLAPGGTLAMEHGFDQGAAVRAICTEAGLVEATTTRDLAEQDRVTSARRPE